MGCSEWGLGCRARKGKVSRGMGHIVAPAQLKRSFVGLSQWRTGGGEVRRRVAGGSVLVPGLPRQTGAEHTVSFGCPEVVLVCGSRFILETCDHRAVQASLLRRTWGSELGVSWTLGLAGSEYVSSTVQV